MTRGDVANYFGITKRTLRHYEDLGLIQPSKKDHDYRYFADEDISTITVIRMLRELGWSLPKIQHLMQECDLKEYTQEIWEQMQQLLTEQKLLTEKMEKVSRLFAKVNRATQGTVYEILEEGPVLLWQSRQYEIGHAESNWFSIMPAAAISGIMTFVLGEKPRVETGLAIHESCGLSAEIAPETVTKRIVTGKCVHCVRPCRMKEGEYIFEDYEPILEYASEQGYASRGWLVTYGLAHIHANTDPTYYLDIWLPIQEKEKQ